MKRWTMVGLLVASQTLLADVTVTFKIESVTMKAICAADPNGAAAATAQQILPLIRPSLPQWKYMNAAGGSGELVFRVTEKLSGEQQLELKVKMKNGGVVYTSPRVTWLEAGQVESGEVPLPPAVPGDLAKAVVDLLVEPYREAIFTAMQKNVPITEKSQWLRTPGKQEEPRIVLALPWKDGKALRTSKFRVSCNWPEKETSADLYADALTTSAKYEEGPVQYQALVLKPTTRKHGATMAAVSTVVGQVRQLKPLAVFLESFDISAMLSDGDSR